jgi:acyl dehydratase
MVDFSFQEGDQFKWERTISAEDVRRFAEVVGDLNPIHIDEEFASTTSFKKRIVHGAFLGGLDKERFIFPRIRFSNDLSL